MATTTPAEGPRKDEDSLLNALINESEARGDRPEGGEAPEDPWEALWRDISQVDRLRAMLGGPPAQASEAEGEPGDPEAIGRFAILGRVGSGGFGIVYRARDPKLGRDVALKVPHPGRSPSAEVRQRFLREARAAAGLDHPNIVSVLEAGVDDSQLYIASTYCEGPNLAQWVAARAEPFPPRQAAQLVLALADAIAHAHGRGVYHRDIKPSNILLQLAPRPNRGAVAEGGDGSRRLLARIADFGLARIASESTDLTSTREALGTPPYMAPEQVSKERQAPGPGPDIYGLGATLYELLTGRPPFQGPSPDVVLLQVVADDPVPPRKIRPQIPRDLESICLRCLEKDPKRRYPTAEALGCDLGRFLDGDRIEARPRPAWYRLRRWSRRRPALAATLLLVLPTLLLAALSAWIMDGRLRDQSRALDAEARHSSNQKRLLDLGSELAQVRLASEALAGDQIEEAQDILDAIEEAPDPDNPRGFAWRLLQREARRPFTQLRAGGGLSSSQVALSGDGRSLACGIAEDLPGANQLIILDYPSGEIRSQVEDPRLHFAFLAVGHRGRWAATKGLPPEAGPQHVYLWDAAAGRLAREWAFAGEEPRQAGFFGDDRIFAAVHAAEGKCALRLWDIGTDEGREGWPRLIHQRHGLSQVAWGTERIVAIDADRRLMEIDPLTGGSRTLAPGPVPRVGNLVVSADDRVLAACEPRRGLVAWELGSRGGPARLEFEGHLARLAISPRGSVLAAADPDGNTTIWEPKGGRARTIRLLDLERDPETGSEIAIQFSPDESRLATSFLNGPQEPIRLWDVASGRRESSLSGRAEFSNSLQFTEKGRGLLANGTPPIRRWKVPPPPPPAQPEGHADEVWALAFSPDSRTLISAGNDTKEPHTLRAWDVETGGLLRAWKAHESTITTIALHPGGKGFASGSLDFAGSILLWDPPTGRQLGELGGKSLGIIRGLAFSPDGRTLASGGFDGKVRLWDYETRQARGTLGDVPRKIRSLAFSPDSSLLAAASEDHFVRIWDLSRPGRPASAKLSDQATSLAFHPDGRRLIAADRRGIITILDPETGNTLDQLRNESLEILSLALHPDGRTLAAAGMRKSIRLWDLETGMILLDLKGHGAQINALAFSPDGRLLASADHDGIIKFWRGGPLSGDE